MCLQEEGEEEGEGGEEKEEKDAVKKPRFASMIAQLRKATDAEMEERAKGRNKWVTCFEVILL